MVRGRSARAAPARSGARASGGHRALRTPFGWPAPPPAAPCVSMAAAASGGGRARASCARSCTADGVRRRPALRRRRPRRRPAPRPPPGPRRAAHGHGRGGEGHVVGDADRGRGRDLAVRRPSLDRAEAGAGDRRGEPATRVWRRRGFGGAVAHGHARGASATDARRSRPLGVGARAPRRAGAEGPPWCGGPAGRLAAGGATGAGAGAGAAGVRATPGRAGAAPGRGAAGRGEAEAGAGGCRGRAAEGVGDAAEDAALRVRVGLGEAGVRAPASRRGSSATLGLRQRGARRAARRAGRADRRVRGRGA